MKKLFTLKTMLLALLCVMGVSSTWAEVVTFTFKTDTDITYTASGTSGGGAACDVTKSNVRLEGSNAYTASTKTLSCYANSTLKITAPGNITQIELSYNGQVYPFDEAKGSDTKGSNGKFSASGAHGASYTPATPATSITLNNTNSGKTELLTLTVTYTSGTVVNVTGVSLDITSKTIMVDENFKLTPTVSPNNATNKAVNWSTSDESVATVSGGTVLGVGAGTATITATTANGNKTATCIVTVTPKTAPTGAVFFETFDKFNGVGGIDGTWSGITTSPALGTYDNSGWTTEGSLCSGYKCVSIRKKDSSTPSGLTSPAVGITGDGSLQFKAESWGTDGSNFFVDIVGGGTFVADENLASENISNEGSTAKVAMTKTGNFTTYNLKFTGLTATSKFRFYAPANKRAFLDDVAVIGSLATSYSLTIGESGYSTFYDSEHKYIVPEGMTTYSFGQNNETLKYGLQEEYSAGGDRSVVPEGVAQVLKAAPGTYTLQFTTESAWMPGNNMLKGTDTEATTTADLPGAKFYALSLNAAGETSSVGFYWMTENGAAFTNGAHKAYLTIDEGMYEVITGGAPKMCFLFNDDDATAITNAKVSKNNDAVIYNLAGQRVAPSAKGILIKNGKKYVNK